MVRLVLKERANGVYRSEYTPYNNAWIQGTFMAHSYRKKVWKQVVPQMIQAIEIKEMEISQQGKENGNEYTLS